MEACTAHQNLCIINTSQAPFIQKYIHTHSHWTHWYMHTGPHIHTHTYWQTHTATCAYTHIHTSTCTHTHSHWTHWYMHTGPHIHTHTYWQTHTATCAYTHIHTSCTHTFTLDTLVHAHRPTHTHTHTHQHVHTLHPHPPAGSQGTPAVGCLHSAPSHCTALPPAYWTSYEGGREQPQVVGQGYCCHRLDCPLLLHHPHHPHPHPHHCV